jgi:hypothetical protein
MGQLAPHECKRWPDGKACTDASAATFAGFESVTNGVVNDARVDSTTSAVGGSPVSAVFDSDVITPGIQGASCPKVPINPVLTASKLCDGACLKLLGGVPRINNNFHGAVCNTSNVQLTNVQATDDPAATITFSNSFAGTLGPGSQQNPTCAAFTGTYLPTTLPDANGNYPDEVTATASSPLGGTVSPAKSGIINCPVCPLGNCPP